MHAIFIAQLTVLTRVPYSSLFSPLENIRKLRKKCLHRVRSLTFWKFKRYLFREL